MLFLCHSEELTKADTDHVAFLYLFRSFVEGNRGIHKLETVLHLQHQLLPMGSNLLCTLTDHIHVIVIRLQHCLCLLLNLQGTLMRFLARGENSGVQWSTSIHFLEDLKGSHFHCVNDTSIHVHKHPSTKNNCLILDTA